MNGYLALNLVMSSDVTDHQVNMFVLQYYSLLNTETTLGGCLRRTIADPEKQTDSPKCQHLWLF